MKMLDTDWRLRKWLARGIATILILWPLTHMGLAKFHGLNSWKVAGWGMYAMAHPGSLGVHGIVLDEDLSELPTVDLGKAISRIQLAAYADGELHPMDYSTLTSEDDSRLGRMVMDMRVFRSRRAMRSMAQELRERLDQATADSDVLFLVVTPHLAPTDRISYTRTAAYLVTPDGEVEDLGELTSDHLTSPEILTEIVARASRHGRSPESRAPGGTPES